MKNNIVDFKQRRKAKMNKKYDVMTQSTIDDWVEENIRDLMKATKKSYDEAITMASDFYMRYPALIEFVRSPEYMKNRKR